jgi:hypothetical protein
MNEYPPKVLSVPHALPMPETKRALCKKCRYQISDKFCAIFGIQEGEITIMCSRFIEKSERKG